MDPIAFTIYHGSTAAEYPVFFVSSSSPAAFIRAWPIERIAHYLDEPAETIDHGVPLRAGGRKSGT
jgi:hypothetical protein